MLRERTGIAVCYHLRTMNPELSALADIGCGSGEVMSATLVPDGMERTEAQLRTILGTVSG
jgi:hypothetical protein